MLFNDVNADMISNNELHPAVSELFIWSKVKYFFGFHYTVILSCTKRCKTKHHTFFHYEYSR